MAPASETACRLDVEGLVREHERERDATSTGDMDALMARHFGPPREEAEAERTARGLKEVEALSAGALELNWRHASLLAPTRQLGPPLCRSCGSAGALSACGKCGVAKYCSRHCQVTDWKARHKRLACAALAALGPSQRLADVAAARAAAESLIVRLRLYALPFAAQGAQDGRGFLLLQSETPLDALALPGPVDCAGRALETPRAVLLHFVSLREFDEELSGALPALAAVRAPLAAAIESHDPDAEAVLLLHVGPSAQDSFTAVAVAPYVPEPAVCRALGAEYAGRDALQIDLDDLGGGGGM